MYEIQVLPILQHEIQFKALCIEPLNYTVNWVNIGYFLNHLSQIFGNSWTIKTNWVVYKIKLQWLKKDSVSLVQIFDETVCLSFTPAMSMYILLETGQFKLSMSTYLREGKLKLTVLCKKKKKLHCVASYSCPAQQQHHLSPGL